MCAVLVQYDSRSRAFGPNSYEKNTQITLVIDSVRSGANGKLQHWLLRMYVVEPTGNSSQMRLISRVSVCLQEVSRTLMQHICLVFLAGGQRSHV